MRAARSIAGDLAEQHGGVLLAGQDLTGRRGDLALGEDAGRDLVEQRLEEVVGRLGDHGDVDVGPLERLGAEQPTEARADHHHAVSVCLPLCAAVHGSSLLARADRRRRPGAPVALPTSPLGCRTLERALGTSHVCVACPRVERQGAVPASPRDTNLRTPEHPWSNPVPLNRPALTLGSGPRGVHDARRWVVRTCTDIGRDDLVECAELGVSELVTNALLHGEPPIQVRVRGTVEHPRIEVRDSSREAPILPGEALDVEQQARRAPDLRPRARHRGPRLRRVGRRDRGRRQGRLVRARRPPSPTTRAPPGRITGSDGSTTRRSPTRDRVRVEILRVPLRLYIEFQQHFRELRREVRLLALAHEDDYPLAKSLSDLFGTLDRHLREGIGVEQIEAAIAENRTETNLVVHMPRATARTLSPLHRAARPRRRLLPPAAAARPGPHRRAAPVPDAGSSCEFVRQAEGEEPVPWTENTAEPPQLGLVTPAARPLPPRWSRWPSAAPSGAVLRWSARRGSCPTAAGSPGRRSPSTSSGCLAIGLLPALRRSPGAPGARRRARTRVCSAASRPCRRTPSRRRALLADGDTWTALAYLVGTLGACLGAVLLAGRLTGDDAAEVVEP